ncbi:GNAT family N-acetyltransferase [Bacillus lacus]|uniref:GNAT family N-acetyltransferase n=1 Tax=Metabacillus lacus TaxID=1983721 RepID=A0A7X2IW43_9BACI|nr:GNAT family N-acetyltransferase [Metabacillus lacus]MRX70719.1 GNAT family N-acetyltransferase [Metabacillus lacus]
MLIRAAEVKDACSIARVNIVSWQSSYKGLISKEFLETMNQQQQEEKWNKILSASSANSRTFVAEDESEGIIGYISGGVSRDDNILTYKGELYAIYLLEHFQRKGVGKKLLFELCTFLKNAEVPNMFVWVFKENPGKNFYISHGAELITEEEVVIGRQKLVERLWVEKYPFIQ